MNVNIKPKQQWLKPTSSFLLQKSHVEAAMHSDDILTLQISQKPLT